jgi:HAD superfamily hydrolase (TIGR01509 family)
MLQAILFDLDGTLLPMDNDYFTKTYFKLLAQTATRWGYNDPKLLTAAVWKGVEAMVRNDGACSNYDRFWQAFAGIMGEDSLKDLDKFSTFYENEFHAAKSATEPAPLARAVVELAHKKADKVILATNPIFPKNGDETRMSWIDLTMDDFDLVTDYQNSCHCKPNPVYYQDVLSQFNLDPAQCLMIGNDVQEDLQAAQAVGLPVYLLDDHLINRENAPITCPHSSYADLLRYLENL